MNPITCSSSMYLFHLACKTLSSLGFLPTSLITSPLPLIVLSCFLPLIIQKPQGLYINTHILGDFTQFQGCKGYVCLCVCPAHISLLNSILNVFSNPLNSPTDYSATICKTELLILPSELALLYNFSFLI